MKKIYLSLGFMPSIICAINPAVINKINESRDKDKLKWVTRDLGQVIRWFEARDASKKSFLEIDKHLSSEWKTFTNEVAHSLGQPRVPKLKYGSLIKYKMTSKREYNRKILYEITFKVMNEDAYAISNETKFLSSNIYYEKDDDDFVVATIKSLLRNSYQLKYQNTIGTR